ncbi:MAG: L,D-transpeptidase [Deltaproteobacteria bacterium]|nr:L,D-transpeptidase [Deltaproteobacteria bacterium]MBK8713433.1 L,D-transpeptidase [Deltaproteobacteria bacterium]MBP7288058.1 L,D-transpeptidase [Nannocystaceae bacterium]
MRRIYGAIGVSLLLACDRQGEAHANGRTEIGARAPADESAAKPTSAGERPSAAPDVAPPVLADAAPTEPAEDRPDEAVVPEEPAPPVAPADYGVIKPSQPAPEPEALTMYAIAGYEVVAIHDTPDPESPKLGYLRIGARTRVTAKVEGTGCTKGWHQLPQGGFACANKGLVVDADRDPVMKNAPPPPRTDQGLPYDYAYVKRWNSPMWWRVPTPDEAAAAEQLRVTRETERLAAEAAEKGLPPPAPAKPKPKPSDAGGADMAPAAGDAKPADDAAAALPSIDDEPDAEQPKPKKQDGDKADGDKPKADKADGDKPKAEPVAPAEPTIPASRLPLKPEKSWLERGFYVSVVDKITEEGRTWWRTARGGFVDVAYAYKFGAKDFEGNPLSEGASFPFGYVMSETTKLIELQPDGKLKTTATLEKRAFVDLSEEVEIGGRAYMSTPDGHLIRKADLRLAEPQPLPKGLQPWERWVDVSLDKQILVAYEGETPVFTSLVSTGKKGTAEEPFETPTGRWRIRSKHISTTMDGNTASDGNYSIQDVPWTMFFEGSYALHGAFWHQGFGRVRSHGCVNLGPSAARWLFYWTTPFLPEGWHGVHAHAGSPGTTVIVRR